MRAVIKALAAAVLAIGALTCSEIPASADPPAAAAAGSPGVHLPRDEAPHDAPTEWWYFSGHLAAVDPAGHAHRYGFEYVTFQFRSGTGNPVYVADLSVTDLTRHTFAYTARTDSYPAPTTPGSFQLHTGRWTMTGDGRHDTLTAALPDYALDLDLHTTGPATLHGTDGEIPFGPFGTSAYYSFTALRAGGTVVDHGTRMQVDGVSWMDHQWGAFDFSQSAGWDWFSVQLTDHTRYMLYFIRDSAGQIVTTVGTRIDADDDVTHLPAGSFAEQAHGSWTSPATDITYASGWTVTVPGGTLTVRPDLVDQELDLRRVQGVAYWEGSVSVRGRIDGRDVAGVGYTEINPAGQP